MKHKTLPIVLGCLVLGSVLHAQIPAAVTVRGWSMQLQPTSRNDPTLGTVTTYFSTYDGRNDIPPLYDNVGGTFYFSGECKPTSPGSAVYRTDYLAVSSIYGYFEDGHATLNIPLTDTDGNGFPDLLQKERSANVNVSGSATSIWPSTTTDAITGTLVRTAGSTLGAYSVTFQASGTTIFGTWSIQRISGTADFTRASTSSISFELNSVHFTGAVSLFTGSSTFTTPSTTSAVLAPFTGQRHDGAQWRVVNPVNLTWQGNHYQGAAQLDDGLTDTSWVDFRDLQVEIQVNANSNGTGAPDLTDDPPAPNLDMRLSGGNPRMTFPTVPGYQYSVYSSGDLKIWVHDQSFTANSNSRVLQPGKVQPGRFYKVQFP